MGDAARCDPDGLSSPVQNTEPEDIRLRVALKAADIGIWEWNLETGEMDYTARAREIFGLGDGPVTVERVRAVTHPQDLPRTSAIARRAINASRPIKEPYKFRILRENDGELRWALAHGEAIFADREGKPQAVRYIGTIQDITDQVNADEALARSEARLRLAIEAAGMAVWEYDGATDALTTSPELNRLFGFPEDAAPDIDAFRARYAPGERDKVQQATRAAIERGSNYVQVEFQTVLPDGSPRWRLLRAQVDLDLQGRFKRVIGVVMDIDEQKRGEERQKLLLRELNHRVKNTLGIAQSLASQTFRNFDAHDEALATFRNRLSALAKANDVLIDEEWSTFNLHALVREIIEPFRDRDEDPFVIDGGRQMLPPHLTVPLAMALHELCTNAAKYGALSQPGGSVSVTWRQQADGIAFAWHETGGPPVAEPTRRGFGTTLLSERLSPQLGEIDLRFEEPGLVCRMLLSKPGGAA